MHKYFSNYYLRILYNFCELILNEFRLDQRISKLGSMAAVVKANIYHLLGPLISKLDCVQLCYFLDDLIKLFSGE